MSRPFESNLIRRKTAAQWAALNTTLKRGELVIEKDTFFMKIGDGVNPWATLPYLPPFGPSTTLEASYLPPVATTEVYVVANQAAMLALTAQPGDMAIRSDTSETYILQNAPATVLGNWVQLPVPTVPVLSVNTKTGSVVLDPDDLSDAATTNKFVTASDLTNLGNLSGTNTGDQTNISGNAATVTTNANLTGTVTSIGNVTSIANGAISDTMLANTAVANLSGTNTGDQTNITGNAATVTTNADLTGPVTSVGNATTITDDAVTNAKLANVATATIKGRTTAGAGDPEDLTGTQATALLDVFTTVDKGLSPPSPGGTTQFMRADGSWATPPSAGAVSAFISTDQTITPAGSLTIAHGLGGLPVFIQLALVCTTAEFGYSIGDVSPVAPGAVGKANHTGTAITRDATNIYIRYGSGQGGSAPVFSVVNKTSGLTQSITNSSWNLRIIAIK